MKKLLKSVAALSLSAMMLLSPGVLAEEDEEESNVVELTTVVQEYRQAGSWRPLKCIFSGKKELRVKIAPRRKIFAEIRPKQAAAIRVVSARGNLRLT